MSVKRNDPCPCASGKKYKNCCMNRPGGAVVGATRKERETPAEEVYRQATVHHQAGRFGRAIQLYKQVLRRQPKALPALHALGQLLGELGKLDQSIGLLRRAIAIDDSRAHIHAVLGAHLLETGRGDEAIRCMRRAVELEPQTTLFHCTLAEGLERINRVDEAIDAVDAAEAVAPDDPHVAFVRAVLDRRRGELDTARDRLERMIARDDVPPNLRGRAIHELARVQDQLGLYDDAFQSFERSGGHTAEYRVTRIIDPETWIRRIDEYREGFTPELLGRFEATSFDDGLSLGFLVGFPRSGTTLTEQVLSAHPQIVSSDERQLINAVKEALKERVGGDATVPQMLERVEPEQVLELRSLYRELAEDAAGARLGSRMFLDKLPLNIVELGVINVLFPDAKIIVALRDPRDCCLSCVQQDFRINAAMAHFLSLESTVRFYDRVMDLYLHQRDLLTLDRLQIRYEDTVDDLESQARTLLDRLGKPWDPAVLQFHEKARERLISTPSFAAVTEKVHTRAVARWKNYAKQLEPYQMRLARFVDEFGYDAAPV